MTTIAVSRSLLMMASDTSVTIGNTRAPTSPKMWRLRDAIVGVAGNLAPAEAFIEWLEGKRSGGQPRGDYAALMLHRDGRISWWHPGHREKFIEDDFFAIGSGEAFALGAMETMRELGLPVDPRIAVRAAAARDTMTAEPIRSLRWKPRAEKA